MTKPSKFLFLFLVCINLGCMNNNAGKTGASSVAQEPEIIEVHGHRGDRGNFPENSIPAFLSAVKKGVDVLEMDVVISKDKQVVVSHEPFMASLFMLNAAGESIPETKERAFNLYKLNYDSIKQFDAGSKGNRLFPSQQKMKTYKPLLSSVIDSVKNYIAAEGIKPVKFSIELKSDPAEYNISQPTPDEFIELVMEVIMRMEVKNFILIQSFDPEILNIMHRKYPEIELAYLVAEGGIEENLKHLNFIPAIYSPYYKLVKNTEYVDSIRTKEMRLIPWTINEPKDIESMIELGVDGIISDYPERVMEKLQS